MKNALIIGVLAVASACAFGQVDRSKEVKPIVTDKPAVEHFYSCPKGYELKSFVKAMPAFVTTAVNTTTMYIDYSDHYQDAQTQDILRTGEPTCVPLPKPIQVESLSGSLTTQSFVFPACGGKSITLRMDTGLVDIPKDCPMDKAAKDFWEFLKQYAKGQFTVVAPN